MSFPLKLNKVKGRESLAAMQDSKHSEAAILPASSNSVALINATALIISRRSGSAAMLPCVITGNQTSTPDSFWLDLLRNSPLTSPRRGCPTSAAASKKKNSKLTPTDFLFNNICSILTVHILRLESAVHFALMLGS